MTHSNYAVYEKACNTVDGYYPGALVDQFDTQAQAQAYIDETVADLPETKGCLYIEPKAITNPLHDK